MTKAEMREHTCCFTGHRKIPQTELGNVKQELRKAIISAINDGYLYFGAGGALGFDTLAAQTVLELKKKYPDTLLIFLTPPSAQELYDRLKGRGTETDEVIAKRMKRASEEVQSVKDYDYLVINDNIDDCTARVHDIIQSAHHTTGHEAAMIEKLKTELEAII